MAETRVLTPVLRLVEEAGGKALLVGDPAQLPAVGAGGLYEALCDRVGAVQPEDNHRQREVVRARRPRPTSATATPSATSATRPARDAFWIADDAAQAKEQLLADWWRAAPRATCATP